MSSGRWGTMCVAAVALLLTGKPVCAAESPRPHRQSWEVGGFGDALFISRFHNLQEPGKRHFQLAWPAVLLGGRAGFTPEQFVSVELEAALGTGGVGEATSPGYGPDDLRLPLFFTGRAQLVAQVPGRFTPFALLGVGVLGASTSEMGNDVDVLGELGVGVKFYATRYLIPRLDLRLDTTQREDGGLSDGIALHGEVMLGLSGAL